MSERHLPGHIAAALAGNKASRDTTSGHTADSAGQPWAGRDLSGSENPLHRFTDDDGSADPGLARALEMLRTGKAGEREVVRALAGARVFAPVVATATMGETEGGDLHDKEAHMALVSIAAPDGRAALPVFSSVAALEAWHPDARPVAVWAPRAALAAAGEKAQLLVLDPGSDLTFVVRRPAMWALAQQRDWEPSYESASLARTLEPLVARFPALSQVKLAPSAGITTRDARGTLVYGGGAGPELQLTLVFGTPEAGAKAACGAAAPSGTPAPPDIQGTVAAVQEILAATPEFARDVDSLQIKIERS